ncbi:putative C6 transcription factor [Aspergillus ruber CBS 135680]|uniref:Putative C6 transcription factor n=1 Tax=Aspergillus ruber (strain CBS 135680) TaxID=1388766 RepID=A0A017SDE9_ASPRC|nr:putative C6 transcription factor [Aspergillus ruber CBS 135680]EYE94972.1 putative C6 transcription factor [Aspergillus ruber CBS 135680]
MNESQYYRQIAPGPSPTSEEASRPTSAGGEIAGGGNGGSSQWKKRVSTACLACKKSKRKCSGTAPCDNCRAFNRVCVFDESLDQRRRVAAKRTADELTYHRDLLNDLFKLIRAADESHALKLLEIIRKDASAEEIRSYVDETLVGLDSTTSQSKENNKEVVNKLEDVRQMLNVEGTGPSFRRKVMDIHFLCDEAPCKVPAKPWTTVTEDDDLVSHLISLYFTWDYPFYSFLDRDVFLRHMAMGNLETEFCSPFLVNAILANACYFSEFTEAYVIPGDILTKGADFLAEAERLRQQETAKIGLCSLQGTLCLYERYALTEDDDMGYLMLHQAIRAGETLGLIGDKGVKMIPEQLSFDMDTSLRRTAWGLFHVDTVIHTSFLRPSLVAKVNMKRIDRNGSTNSDLWIPYPSHRNARSAYLSQYFDETCNLSEIALDISKELFSEDRSVTSASQRRQAKENLYERLRRWHGALPRIFGPETKPPPYIILLRMRYYTLVINVFACNTDDDVSSTTSDAPKTPESEPRHSPTGKYNAWELTQSAARGIASLTRLHRREYGMTRAHYFAMYAINLALFAMLESESFDILDPDFLSLSSSFFVIASRSHLGRNLFHIFRQSVRSKSQGKRIRESSGVSEELKELFDEDAIAKGQNWLDDYANGLEKLNQDDRYNGLGNGSHDGEDLQEYPGLGLFDMLDRYESLSLGKDEIVAERNKQEEW